jgi:hypothetical protein
MVSKSFPEADRQLFKLFDDYFASTLDQKTGAGNVLKTINYVSQKANVLNRMQDRAIKSAGFMTELDNQIKVAIRRGEITDPDIKGIEDVIRQDKMNLLNDTMVSESLGFAYRLTYQTRNAGDDLIIGGKMINNLQRWANTTAAIKLGIPFPNFIFNGIVYNLNRGLGFGAAKAAVNARRIAKFDDVAIKKAANRSKQIQQKIDRIKKLSSTKVKQIQERAGDKNFINTQLKKLTNELDELDAAAGKRLKNVEDLRKGIVETVEGVTFISAAYAIRENFGGARYDEIKVGNNSINVGPLFPLTPYLFIGEFIRKVINDEPIDKTFVGEGIEALTGFQTDRAGPISKFVGGLRKTLDTLSNDDDPNSYRKIGEEIGAFAGYIAKGYLSPLKAFDDLVKTFGSRESRQTYDRDFQNVISEESDTLSGEVIRGVFNEFAKQMFRGTSAQGMLGGSEDPTISVTGKEQKIQSAPFAKQLSGIAAVAPRDSVGEELERLGIPSWKLARRSSIPEYTRLFKIKLGKESEKYVKPIVESRKYKALPFKIQLQIIDNLYNGDKGDMSPEAQRAYRTFGPIYNNLKERVSDEIKNEYKLLDELHKFRTRNSKTEISRSYEEAERKGVLPPLKYLGEDTADNRNVAEARDQSDKLKKFQTIIDDPRYKMGEYINRAKGGYVSQMNALGFAEGGNVGGDEMGLATSGRDRIEDRPESVRVPSTQALDITGDGKVNHVDLVEALRPTAPQEYKEMAENIASLIDKEEFAKAAGLTAIMGASVVPLGRSATAPARRSITRELNEMPDNIDTSVVKSDIAPEGLSSTPNKIVESKEDVINFRDDPKQIDEWKDKNRVSQEQKQIPEVAQAGRDLFEGKIASRKFREIVEKYNPIKKITAENFPNLPTNKDISGALKTEQRSKLLNIDVDIPDGTLVGARLDIPAYERFDTWIVTLHEGGRGSAKAYGQVAVLKGGIEFKSATDTALGIARDKKIVRKGEIVKSGKATIGRMEGKFYNSNPEETYKKAYDIVANPDKYSEWTQVGFNPYRQSQFYNKDTGMPIFDADEVIQVGPLVLAKNVKKPTKQQLRSMKTKVGRIDPKTELDERIDRSEKTGFRLFNAGGAVNKQMNELGF